MLRIQIFVSASGYASNRSTLNFPSNPSTFDPSRWMSKPADTSSADTKPTSNPKSAFDPFSFGPRNCLGRYLARLEMRLILTHLLWTFDLEVADGDTLAGWEEQKSWILRQKAPLRVKLVVSQAANP